MDKKWNLQDIKPSRPKVTAKKSAPIKTGTAVKSEKKVGPYQTSADSSRRFYYLLVAFLFIAVVVGLVYNFLSAGAVIEVQPRQQTITLNGTFTASKEPSAQELGFETVSVTDTTTVTVPTSGEEQVSEQATGEILIRNNTNKSERLIKNTRFESPDGLVYRITESAVVPAAVNGEPGTVRAKVFADQPGDSYNIEAGQEFTVPGYAENGFTALFESITATNPEPITGGFVGVQYIVEEEDLEEARATASATLRETLGEKLLTSVPSTLVSFPVSVNFEFETLPNTEGSESSAEVTVVGTASAPAFLPTELSSFLARASIAGYEGQPVRIDDYDSLTFELLTPGTATSSDTSEASPDLAFTIEGQTRVVFTFDETALKADLAGKPKTALTTVLSGYPAIQKSKATFKPFWRQTYPSDPEEITVIELLNNE